MDLRSATVRIEGTLFDWEWDHERRLTASQAEAMVRDGYAAHCKQKGWVRSDVDEEKLVRVLCRERGYIIGLKFAEKPRRRVLPLPDGAETRAAAGSR